MVMLGTAPEVAEPPAGGQLRAFPGAEGLAALTRGAAGYSGTPTVVRVTNTNSAGAGSFREAVAGAGTDGRFIVFTVSGNIDLTTNIDILSSNITVFGQTSPGGICIAGSRVRVGTSTIQGHNNIIFQHMRFRPADLHGHPDEELESFSLSSPNNVMVDHCSFSWGGDETTSVTTYSGGTSFWNITFSHCLISDPIEGLVAEGNHEFAMLINSNFQNVPENTIDIHHCYFAHSRQRHPQFAGRGSLSMVNCAVFDFELFRTPGAYLSGNEAQYWNFISNYIKSGAASNNPIGSGLGAPERTAEMHTNSGQGGATEYEAFYVFNNFGQMRQVAADDEWCVGNYNTANTPLSTNWQRSTPFTTTEGVAITATTLNTDAATAEAQMSTMMADMGATKPVRDSHDALKHTEFDNTTSGFESVNPTFPDDWPTLSTASDNPADDDNNGIPNTFETAHSYTVGTLDEVRAVVQDDIDNHSINSALLGYLMIEAYAWELTQ